MDSEKNTAVGRKSLLRRHVKLTLRYVRTFVLWAAAGLVIGALGGLIGTAFCYAIREATQLRGAYPWLLYFLPAGGLLILRDGTPGEAEVTLSPLRYHWQHRAEVEVFVRGSSGLELAFDTLAEGIGQVIAADRTLGGLCDWIETDAPEPADLAVEGAPTIRAAVLILTLHYTSNDPLG